VPGPVLVASYPLSVAGFPSVTTPSFSPSAGELIVAKCAASSSVGSLNVPTDSAHALTFTQRVNTTQQSLINGIWTAPVVAPPGSITVTVSAPAGFVFFSAVVERWSGAQLAASPVTDDRSGTSSVPTGTITTAKANSVVSWLLGTNNNPSSYIATSGTPVQELQFSNSSYVYQPAASAGAQSYGVAAPPNLSVWHLSALEIQSAAAPSSGLAMVGIV
jgi:hypothetical protein